MKKKNSKRILSKDWLNFQLKEKTNQLYQEADEVSKIIGSSVLTLKGKK